jgi:hypothetical protein
VQACGAHCGRPRYWPSKHCAVAAAGPLVRHGDSCPSLVRPVPPYADSLPQLPALSFGAVIQGGMMVARAPLWFLRGRYRLLARTRNRKDKERSRHRCEHVSAYDSFLLDLFRSLFKQPEGTSIVPERGLGTRAQTKSPAGQSGLRSRSFWGAASGGSFSSLPFNAQERDWLPIDKNKARRPSRSGTARTARAKTRCTKIRKTIGYPRRARSSATAIR